jgi:hypothetical protein
MIRMSPLGIILLGFALVLLGWIIPFLMVLGIIQADFCLSFLSYGASVAGLFMGVIGTAFYVRSSKHKGKS